MSLLRLPRGKLLLAFLAVPAGQGSPVECPCQTVDDIIGVRGNVCGLFLFVQTHAPLTVPPCKAGREIKVPIFIRRKGADAFRPALAAGGSLMAYKCLSLCDFFIVQQFFKLCHICKHDTPFHSCRKARMMSRVWGRHAPTRSLGKLARV